MQHRPPHGLGFRVDVTNTDPCFSFTHLDSRSSSPSAEQSDRPNTPSQLLLLSGAPPLSSASPCCRRRSRSQALHELCCARGSRKSTASSQWPNRHATSPTSSPSSSYSLRRLRDASVLPPPKASTLDCYRPALSSRPNCPRSLPPVIRPVPP